MVSATVNVRVVCSLPPRAANVHGYRLYGTPHFFRGSSMASFTAGRYKMLMMQTRHTMLSTNGKC